MEDFPLKQIIYSVETTLTEESNRWKQFVFFSHTKSNIQKTSSYWEEIMSVQASTEFMAFMMSVSCKYLMYIAVILLKFKPHVNSMPRILLELLWRYLEMIANATPWKCCQDCVKPHSAKFKGCHRMDWTARQASHPHFWKLWNSEPFHFLKKLEFREPSIYLFCPLNFLGMWWPWLHWVYINVMMINNAW